VTAEDKNQVAWRVVVLGDTSPSQRLFDEGWLLDSRVSDTDIVRCDSAGTEDLSVADSISEFSRFPNQAMSILILVPRKSAPELEQSWDGEVGSFIASVGLLRAFKKTNPAEDCSCYNLLYWALNNRSHAVGFECLQVPIQSKGFYQGTLQDISVQWIIPHKAPLFMLETCLRAVGDSRGSADIVSVCLDEEVTDDHRELAMRFPWAEFYRSEPHSSGPYVSRERFIRSGATPVVLFQDSDDAPTLSRRGVLLAELLESGADLIGSHELLVSEVWRKVVAIRYPLDASAALAALDGHTLLLPTSAGRRDAIKAAGGFSTIRTFNSDLEFEYRAFFFLKLRNVDEFLYIRRLRAGSLTQAPETGILSPAREAHSASLRKDFERIKRKELALEDSALKTQHRSDFEEIRIDRLRPRRSLSRVWRSARRFVGSVRGRT
jgi:hypothetical protein